MKPSLFTPQPFLDAEFMEALSRDGLDYPQVAYQAALLLQPDEVAAMERLAREDKVLPTGSRNFLDLARFITMLVTFGWDSPRKTMATDHTNPMSWAVESLARSVRTMVYNRGNTLEDMMRVAATNTLVYIWHIQPADRFAWSLAMQALSVVPEEDILSRGMEPVMMRVRHLMMQAKTWLNEGPWTNEKSEELARWAELAFSGFTEPSEEAKEHTRREVRWVWEYRAQRITPETAAEVLALMDDVDEASSRLKQGTRAFNAAELAL